MQDRALCAVICHEEFVSGCRHPTTPSVIGKGFSYTGIIELMKQISFISFQDSSGKLKVDANTQAGMGPLKLTWQTWHPN